MLTGCISTEDFNLANDLKATNGRLDELLINAIKADNRKQKKEIGLIAAYAHDTATQIASEGKNKLALGYYRIAAIAYWRDDIKSNNEQFFRVINTAENICKSLDDKAPDRDCFVIRFTPYFSAIDSVFVDEKFLIDTASATNDEAEVARMLLIDLGNQNNATSVDASNGHLVNLLNQANSQSKFLAKHDSLNNYICDNLFNSLTQYIGGYGRVFSYYSNQGNGAEIKEQNPLISEISALQAASIKAKTKAFIVSKVPSCASL